MFVTCKQQTPDEANAEIDQAISEGLKFYQEANFAEALPVFEKAAKKHPGSADLANNVGMCHLQMGDFVRAEEGFKAALSIQKTSKLYVNLGDVQARQGKFNEAVKTLTEATTLDQKNFFAWVALGRAHFSLKEFEKAEKSWNHARTLNESAELLNSLGTLRLHQNKTEDATTLFDKAIKMEPGYAPAYYNLGVLQQKAKEYQKANDNYVRAIAVDAAYLPAYYNLGLVRKELGRKEEAIASFKRFVQLAPKDLEEQIKGAQSEIEGLGK